jgi:hypothetical protein
MPLRSGGSKRRHLCISNAVKTASTPNILKDVQLNLPKPFFKTTVNLLSASREFSLYYHGLSAGIQFDASKEFVESFSMLCHSVFHMPSGKLNDCGLGQARMPEVPPIPLYRSHRRKRQTA